MLFHYIWFKTDSNSEKEHYAINQTSASSVMILLFHDLDHLTYIMEAWILLSIRKS